VAAARASFHPEAARDSELIGAVAWAAFSAARLIGTWMSKPDGLSMVAPTQHSAYSQAQSLH
jgi:hypothetical protein